MDAQHGRAWTLEDTKRVVRAIMREVPPGFTGRLAIELKDGGVAQVEIGLNYGGFKRTE